MSQQKTIYNIEALRGLAAIAIAICHIILFGVNKFNFGSTDWFRLSDALLSGVDLFFVISGFVMVYTTISRPSMLSFLKKRIFRIYPIYWIVSLPLIPVLLYYPQLINSLSPYPTSVLHSLLLLPHQGMPLLMVAWTLEFEVYFYLLFALTLFLPVKKQVTVLAVFFITCVMLGLVFKPGKEQAVLQLVTSPFLMEFVFGMVIAVAAPRLQIRLSSCFLLMAAGLLSVFAIPMNVLPRALHFGVGMALIFIAALCLEKNGTRAREKPALFLGALSYPLYLVHVLVIVGIGRGFQWLGHSLPHIPYALLTFTAAIVAATVLAYGIDRPVQNTLRRFKRPN